jgi:hypothetical protein
MVRRHEIPKILTCPRVYCTPARLRADDVRALPNAHRAPRPSSPLGENARSIKLQRFQALIQRISCLLAIAPSSAHDAEKGGLLHLILLDT